MFLILVSCANSKKKKGFALTNTLAKDKAEQIVKICAENKMDKNSNTMIPVKGFDRDLTERIKQDQIDSTMNIIKYPTQIYLNSFFNFDPSCISTNRVLLTELRTYGDHTTYGKGTFSVSYKIEVIMKNPDINKTYYAGSSKSENLGMFSSKNKSIKYQSDALTSAFYDLYTNIYNVLK